MTTALIWILTPVLVIDCVLLGLLVLIQLPKKEAGMGTAFGGGATDALFGAGSGNTLTKITKYSAGIFFVLVLTLNILNIRAKPGAGFENEFQKAPLEQPATAPGTPDDTNAPDATNSAATLGTTNAAAAAIVQKLQSLGISNVTVSGAPASNVSGK